MHSTIRYTIAMYLQDQMAQEIGSRFKEFNRKRPAERSSEAKPKVQKVIVPEVRWCII